MKKIFVVGDIHGCFDKLQALMQIIPIDYANDQLIFIGDYIDRGSSSLEVMDYLVALKKRVPSTIFLKGNHEDMLEKYLDGSDRFTYLFNGGQRTLDDYLNRTKDPKTFPIPPEHLNFYQSLVMHYQTENYIFVHAGIRENVALELQDPMDLLWIREPFIYSKFNFGKRIIFGHTPFQQPLVQPNKIGIDTGAVYGNMLTCVQLPEVVFYSQ
jgi:serine/threonine protein phosphatase 1